ncbi:MULTISPECIES: hypothetical protein [Pseudomonas]|uniref:hypothetical protein n=1 Tax=Pseudomonas TaxID=286 RepID=UPI000CFFFCFD|nr:MULTISPECIES: hypothetical protein [Pseudomonas]PRA53200.1 hypothetical protein CQZ98_14305 [Pseudomonas sp. MYb115]QXN52198.1 hypothetical protein KW062_10860 [Pseudomonas fluorescens]WSO26527.1 hypothetical protein VUJ50_10920 [Pseudomonas fluorescens]
MELNLKPEGVALVIGALLAIAWIALIVGSKVWQLTWNWIDDDESRVECNPLVFAVMRRLGYTRDRDSTSYPYQKGDGEKISDGSLAVVLPLFLLLVCPLAIVVGFRLYPLVIAAITLFLIARLARFARRHKKLFDKHLKDPEAHK